MSHISEANNEEKKSAIRIKKLIHIMTSTYPLTIEEEEEGAKSASASFAHDLTEKAIIKQEKLDEEE